MLSCVDATKFGLNHTSSHKMRDIWVLPALRLTPRAMLGASSHESSSKSQAGRTLVATTESGT